MGPIFSRRGGARPAAFTPPRVGHFYFHVAGQRLYCLNETARAFLREGVPVGPADLERHPLRTRDGKPVAPAELPLDRCRRDGAPREAVFVMTPPGGGPQTLTWSAAPLRTTDGVVVGVTAALVLAPAEPDWEELAGLAHDLRGPLQTVRWLLPVLESLPAAAGETLVRLRAALDRAMLIAGDLLEWCKSPAQGSPRGVRAWLALAGLLQALAAEQEAAARRKGVCLEVDLSAADGLEAHTDGPRLGRLVANLLGNAVRYTAAGRVRLGAAWRGGPGGARTLVLAVEDTGVGLSAEDAESIFQPFHRGTAGKADGDSTGSGLGLAVVDRLTQELGLTLEVNSEPGRGSRFAVLLPAAILRRAGA
jgi:two-component sensor histidine kinase